MESIELRGQQLGRKAIKFAKRGCYSEAAHCHKECADFFANLQTEKYLPSFQRSWEEQAKYHLRQAEILKELGELNKKERIVRDKIEFCLSKVEIKRNTMSEVETEILKKFEEQESMLVLLANKANANKKIETSTPVVKYTIQPKNDADIIEELRESNASLKILIKELMDQLEKVQAEKRALEKKLEFYETCGMPSSSNLMDAMDRMPAQSQLPELAPLELPPSTF